MRVPKSIVDRIRNVRPVVWLFFLLGYLTLIWMVVVTTRYSLEFAYVTGDDTVVYRSLVVGAGLLAIPPAIVYYVTRNR